eukprot:1177713-Prorocentrum_minimum.AAC.2
MGIDATGFRFKGEYLAVYLRVSLDAFIHDINLLRFAPGDDKIFLLKSVPLARVVWVRFRPHRESASASADSSAPLALRTRASRTRCAVERPLSRPLNLESGTCGNCDTGDHQRGYGRLNTHRYKSTIHTANISKQKSHARSTHNEPTRTPLRNSHGKRGTA